MGFDDMYKRLSNEAKMWIDLIAENLTSKVHAKALSYKNEAVLDAAIAKELSTYENVSKYNPHPDRVLRGLIKHRFFVVLREQHEALNEGSAEAKKISEELTELARSAGHESVDDYKRLK